MITELQKQRAENSRTAVLENYESIGLHNFDTKTRKNAGLTKQGSHDWCEETC